MIIKAYISYVHYIKLSEDFSMFFLYFLMHESFGCVDLWVWNNIRTNDRIKKFLLR